VRHSTGRIFLFIEVFLESAPSDLQDFAARYTAAWCSQNAANVAAFFSTNGSLSANGGPPAVGRSAIQEIAQSFMTAFPDLRVLFDELVVQDGRRDRADYHWTLFGTNNGPGGTGNRVQVSGVENWQIGADGLIAVSRGEFDAAAYQRQIAAPM
jgi:predicted ester cyclase